MRSFAPTFATKKVVTVSATATTGVSIGVLNGPMQVRIENKDTAWVSYRFGASGLAAVLDTDPALPPNGVEVITVMPNSDGSAVFFSVISEASPAGNKFGATFGTGI